MMASPEPAHHQHPPAQQNTPLAVLFLLGQILFSIGIGAAVKSISAEAAFIVIMFCRYFFSLPLLIATGITTNGLRMFHVHQKGILIARSCAGLAGLASFMLAVIHLTLSLATVLSQTMSLFITLLAPILLKEKVGVRRMVSVLFGFGGVLVILNPGSGLLANTSHFGITVGLLAPFCGALMYIFLRKLGTQDSPISTAFWYNFSGTILFFGLFVYSGDSFPEISQENALLWGVLIAIGLASSLQQFMMARSHQLADASTLAPVHYASVPLSICVGIILFSDPIGLNFIAGTAIVIGASWYIFKREQYLKKIGRL